MTTSTRAGDEGTDLGPEVRAGDSCRAHGPVLLTGFGLGGFIDGILFHQVLQWHHFVAGYRPADTLEGLEHNTFWDGVFHLSVWVVVLAGVLWMAARARALRQLGSRRVVGLLLVGTGVFHVVDQIVFHLLLQAHHIRMVENYQVYDWSYFAIGLVLIAVGAAMARRRTAPA